MQIIKLAWVGTRTENAEPTVAFLRDVLGLRLELEGAPPAPGQDSFVDDVQAAAAELRSVGVEILFESGVDDSGNAWAHFRAPDGNIYEFTLTQDPGVSRPH
jgi:catechol 2,3-dioxygenase-like lactoylglutathione lyase family enzyme